MPSNRRRAAGHHPWYVGVGAVKWGISCLREMGAGGALYSEVCSVAITLCGYIHEHISLQISLMLLQLSLTLSQLPMWTSFDRKMKVLQIPFNCMPFGLPFGFREIKKENGEIKKYVEYSTKNSQFCILPSLNRDRKKNRLRQRRRNGVATLNVEQFIVQEHDKKIAKWTNIDVCSFVIEPREIARFTT